MAWRKKKDKTMLLFLPFLVRTNPLLITHSASEERSANDANGSTFITNKIDNSLRKRYEVYNEDYCCPRLWLLVRDAIVYQRKSFEYFLVAYDPGSSSKASPRPYLNLYRFPCSADNQLCTKCMNLFPLMRSCIIELSSSEEQLKNLLEYVFKIMYS